MQEKDAYKETSDASIGQRMSKIAQNPKGMERPGADLLSWSPHVIDVANTLVLDFLRLSITTAVTPQVPLVSASLAGFTPRDDLVRKHAATGQEKGGGSSHM